MALDLGKEIGPLPLGAWIVVVGGGLGIALYTKQNGSGSDEPVVVDDTSGVPGVGEGGSGQWQAVGPGAAAPAPADPKSAVVDNDTWAVYVMNVLIGRYNYDPLLVDSAIRKYISGQKLSASEYTIVREALKIMVPPYPLPADDNTSAPVPNQPPVIKPPTTVPGPVKPRPVPPIVRPPKPKPSARYYTVRKGDNLWNISKKYYGTGTKWATIFAANRAGKRLPNNSLGKISNPSLIQPGWVLHIP